jgi:hypothetical protein
MSREPLILSDTAMVLLREYSEIDKDYFVSAARANVFSVIGYAGSARRDVLESVGNELLSDIWVSWIFPNQSFIRHLDWHFVFTNDLMKLISKLDLSPLQTNTSPENRSLHRLRRQTFLDMLVNAYQDALEEKAETKTTL